MGAGTESSAQCGGGRWSKVSYEKASGQQDKAHSAGARAGSLPVCLPGGLRVSGGPATASHGPSLLTQLTRLVLP